LAAVMVVGDQAGVSIAMSVRQRRGAGSCDQNTE